MSLGPGALAVAALALALALDLGLGEPPAALHPVVWMGKVIAGLERRAPRAGPVRQLLAGGAIALLVPTAFAAGASALRVAVRGHPALDLALSAILLKSTFALRALGRAGAAVGEAVERGDVPAARVALRSLCSRDPATLDAPLLVAATVESLAENASDSFVAPLFYFAVAGVPGAVFYRAVNTLDAMIGYRGRYEYLGKGAARLDDLLNLVPARLTAALILAAGALARKDAGRGLLVLARDGDKTESPNAGRPMAAMAGVLGVELEKRGHYRLGDARNALEARTIAEAWRVVMVAAALAALLVAALAAVVVGGTYAHRVG